MYVCQVRWGDVTGMVVCSVSPAHVIGTFPYVLMAPDDQTGPELQLASFIIGKKCKAADILPTTVSEEYALAVSALCSDDLMRSVIRRINPDRFNSTTGNHPPTPRVLSRRQRSRSPKSDTGACNPHTPEANQAFSDQNLTGLWKVYKAVDERLSATCDKLTKAQEDKEAIQRDLCIEQKAAVKADAAHAKEVGAMERQVIKLEGQIEKLQGKVQEKTHEAKHCSKCAGLKREVTKLKAKVSELEAELEEEQDTKPIARKRVKCSPPRPPPPEDSMVHVLVKERDKNDQLALALTRQLGDTFASIATAFRPTK